MTNMNTQQDVELVVNLLKTLPNRLAVAKALLADPVMEQAIQEAMFGCCSKETHSHGCTNSLCHTSLEIVSECKLRS